VTFHCKPIDFEGFCKRQILVGRSAHLPYEKKYPSLAYERGFWDRLFGDLSINGLHSLDSMAKPAASVIGTVDRLDLRLPTILYDSCTEPLLLRRSQGRRTSKRIAMRLVE
jgi:hypothetical protein